MLYPNEIVMSRKNYTLILLSLNAILNALLINCKILHLVNIDWLYVFTPTWFSIAIVLGGVLRFSLKHKQSATH